MGNLIFPPTLSLFRSPSLLFFFLKKKRTLTPPPSAFPSECLQLLGWLMEGGRGGDGGLSGTGRP